jgi:hypothetical protein
MAPAGNCRASTCGCGVHGVRIGAEMAGEQVFTHYCADHRRLLYYRPMARICTQCRARQAMYDYEGGHSLCLNCHDQLQRIERENDAYNRAVAHYLEEKIYFDMGLSNTPPRVPVPPPAPTRAIIQQDNRKMTTISIDRSNIGMLNTGQIRDVQRIDVNVSQLAQAGQETIASALKNLTEAVAQSEAISDEQRSDLLDQLGELSTQATLPPEQRTKSGVLKAIVGGIGATLQSAGGLAEVWSTWGNSIKAFFGF